MEKRLFEPIGDYNEVSDLNKIREGIIESSERYNIKIDVRTLVDEIDKTAHLFNEKYKEILDYLSQFYGKFVNIKFWYNSNYTDTRDTKPIWTIAYDANVMLCSYEVSNKNLFGLYNKVDDEYQSGIFYKSINLFEMVQEHRFEITEITEEMFIEQAKVSIVKSVNKRKEKNKNRILTKYGYGYQSYIDNYLNGKENERI